MDKQFQKEILETRKTILFNKELKNIDTRNTLKPIRSHTNQINRNIDKEYLIIGDDKTLNNDLQTGSNQNIRQTLFEEIRNSDPTHRDIYQQNQESKQITIDFKENKSNLVTKKNLIIAGICIVFSYISITALNDYIMLSYFQT
jgi:hypothetical protein